MNAILALLRCHAIAGCSWHLIAIIYSRLAMLSLQGVGPADIRWEQYFEDPSQWWDNRATKRNPKGPDFVSKNDRWVVGPCSCPLATVATTVVYTLPAWIHQQVL